MASETLKILQAV